MNIQIRFNGDLKELIDSDGKDEWRSEIFHGKRTVKDLIQSLGVPHTEIGKIVINDRGRDFDHILETKDRVDVYPISPHLLPEKLEPPRFICDVHLWKLTRRLRLLGFDTRFNPQWEDPELAEICHRDHLILLSRDRGLLKRNKVQQGLLIRNTNPEKQVEEVLKRLGIADKADPFSRCLMCNSILQKVGASGELFERLIEPHTPPKILEWCKEFHHCPSCERIFWKGSHYKKLNRMIEKYIEG